MRAAYYLFVPRPFGLAVFCSLPSSSSTAASLFIKAVLSAESDAMVASSRPVLISVRTESRTREEDTRAEDPPERALERAETSAEDRISSSGSRAELRLLAGPLLRDDALLLRAEIERADDAPFERAESIGQGGDTLVLTASNVSSFSTLVIEFGLALAKAALLKTFVL
mmetsp:Transcript_45491/g.91805  ORF Transcript_45491/g.91805 Transcript_45491/m.91805 type:complete len:169 (-) Transcript_45491:182-688(-)